MDPKERQVIDDLFGKLRQVEGQSPQRDPEAEQHIARQVSDIPAAPYYMAQAILVQEQALANTQARVQQLEQQLAQRPAAGGGGFLSGLFGGGQSSAPPVPRQPPVPQTIPPEYTQQRQGGMMGGGGSPWGGRGGMMGGGMGGGGGGFLAGAMQTAVGVAGGMLVANALSDAFSGGAAEAGELATGAADQAGDALGMGGDEAGAAGMEADPVAYEDPGLDAGGDFGGDEEV